MAEKPAVNQGRAQEKAPEHQTQAQAQAQAPEKPRPSIQLRTGRPVVIKVKGKRKKRRYSRGLKGLQRGMRKGSRGGNKFVDAIASGFRKYRRKADKSSRKRRDGMLKDLVKNAGSGMSRTVKRSSKVPRILAKSLGRRPFKRRRCIARRVFSAFGWR